MEDEEIERQTHSWGKQKGSSGRTVDRLGLG